MASLTQQQQQQQALLWNKYWDIREEHSMLQLMANEKDHTIAQLRRDLAQLRRDLVKANNKIAKLEQMIDPATFLSSR
jgi:septal ring factor EnvC (AmiA/AmiB activator)